MTLVGHVDVALQLMRTHITEYGAASYGIEYLYNVSEDTPAVVELLKSRADDIAPLLRGAKARHGDITRRDDLMKRLGVKDCCVS